MKQTKKALAILLAVLMLALSAPFAAVAEGDTWTMTPLIENPNGKTEANEIVFQDEDGFVLNWYPIDESIERYVDGWWVGVKFTAPSADIAETAQYTINGGEKADFVDESQTGDNWMGLWILINEAKVKTALQGDGLINYTVVFYNGAEDADGQTFVVSLDASSLILKNDGAVVMQTVPAKEATATEHGNIAYYTDADGNCFALDEDNVFQQIPLADTVIHTPGNPVRENETAATCTAEGSYDEVVYCAVCNEEISRAEKSIAMIPHTFKNRVEFSEEDGTWYAYGLCSNHMSNIVKEEATWQKKSEATCTEPEMGCYKAVINGVAYESEVMEGEPAFDHDYQFEKFIWSEDGTTATAHYVCANDADHTQDYTAEIISVVTPATCTEAAFTTYTATYEDYEDTNEVTVAGSVPLGHDFTVQTDKSNVAPDPTNEAKHIITCVRGDETTTADCTFELVPNSNTADCENSGTETYRCTVCGREKYEPTDPFGHDYGAINHREEGNNVKGYTVCLRCEKPFVETKPIYTVVDAPTCVAAGTRYYRVNFDNQIFNDEGKTYFELKSETIEIDPDAHDYEFKGFTWTDGEDGPTAIATFTCRNNAAHTETPDATVTKDENASAVATCTAAGKNVYTASVTFNGETYGAEETPHEVVLAKLPHTYGEPAWSWNEDKTAATATFTCANCDKTADGHSVTETATVTTSEAEGDTKLATCTEDGFHKNVATVTFDGKDYTDVQTITDFATGHTYGAPEWAWDGSDKDGYTKATATFTCTVATCAETEDGHKVVIECTEDNEKLVIEKTLATHLVDGKIVYTATATLGEEAYTDAKTVEIKAAGHTVKTEEPVPVTCTTDGSKEYTYCSVCNAILTIDGEDVEAQNLTKTDNADAYTIPATGHTYGEPEWAWEGTDEDGYTKATVTFTCTVDTCAETENGHKVVIECTKANEKLAIETTPVTHLVDGKIVYTATATLGEEAYTDAKTVEIKAAGHTVKTEEPVPVTCTTDGSKEYTYCSVCNAILTIDGEDVEAQNLTKTDNAEAYTIPATGHTYIEDGTDAWTWTKTETGFAATVNIKCASLDDTQTLDAEVKLSDYVSATHLEDGYKTYTAKATIGEGEAAQVFTSTKTDKLPAEGHALVEVPAVAVTCTTDGRKACTYCSKCNVILTIDGEDVEENGYDMTDDAAVLTIAKLGHDWSEWKYLDETYHQRSCTNDSENTHPETEKHEVDVKVIGYPDSLYPNVTTHYQEVEYCTVCGAVLEVLDEWTETAQHQHEYTSVVTREPNCTYEGERTFTCQICGDVVTESIATNGAHADPDNDGYCNYCGDMMTGGDHCPQCGKIHNGGFGDRLTGFFHRIAAFFTRLFR